ncbi:PEP/pyruvate-binding domain-containing protein [Intrasporangium sp. YIM S08009]|uniref:PEP/pyruvate-binding domain-containing protein n=1 Tax=Intrasporangium zincisolvens TaxID=3080018 RepID=UPI002B053810|nr:PEP/pyruvate-binding domain-containing protein [Intrasporangium sp. YIM S08009]
MTTTTPDAYVQFFDGGAEPRHELLGGKCASLVTMTAAGMPVPPGFAVTTLAYDRFVEVAGIAAEIHSKLATLSPDDVSAVDSVSASIRDAICSRPVPPEVNTQVVAAYEQLQSRFESEVPVAVRSSATAEDLPGASFAGQQDTYLWLTGIDTVLQHIRACWASLYTSRAILYRLKNDITDEGLSMAVAVQKMVNSAVSGVAMTMNPTNGDRSKVTIDSSYGVGEMVVSGQVTPDNIVVDKVVLSTVSQTVGDKHAELVPDFALGRLVERDVEAERRARLSLTPEQVTAVATMAKAAEKHYGCPQDVEWAFDRDLPEGSDLLLLQARPETVHSAPRTSTAGSDAQQASTPAAPTAPTTGFSLSGLTSRLTGGQSGH